MAGCATPTSSAGHPGHSATADHALTLTPDHLMGAGHLAYSETQGEVAVLEDRHPSTGNRTWRSYLSFRRDCQSVNAFLPTDLHDEYIKCAIERQGRRLRSK